jgi:hypothetical protein
MQVTKLYRKPTGGCARDCRQGRECPRRRRMSISPKVANGLILAFIVVYVPTMIYFFPR